MAALVPFQTEGMWREVVDLPGAYPEFSATAMITTAIPIAVEAPMRHQSARPNPYDSRTQITECMR